MIRDLASCAQWLSLLCCFFVPSFLHAENLNVHSVSVRARLSEKTVLGKDAPEDFKEYDVSLNMGLPWQHYSPSGWGMGSRLMASAGVLRGAGEHAFVVSLIPELTFGSEDGRFIFDLGAGGAAFTRHRFGTQDFGGPFQFALTLGVRVPVYKKFGAAYRFLHYSDAGLNGSRTIGADFHMLELSYQF